MELVITRHLTWFLENNNVFSPSQTGYRQHRSTEDQLAHLTQDIENSFQEKQKLLAVLFDLSKAFERVWKKRTAVETVESRSFRSNIQMDQQLSLPQNGQSEAWWIAQQRDQARLGSPARKCPLANSVPSACKWHCQYPRVTNSLHADDLAAWNSAEHTSTATHVKQETINGLGSWAEELCTEIICSGTQATLFSLYTVKEKVMLKLEDMPVPQIDNPTFLGVTLGTNLTWKTLSHTSRGSCGKICEKLGLLEKLAGKIWGADTNILRRAA